MRLTKTDRYGHFYTNKANCRNIWSLDGKKLEGELFENQTLAIDGNAIDKLGQLEDIEDELGIDLITFFKALKNGCYYKDKYGAVIRCDKPKVKFDNFTILSHIRPTQQVSCLFYVSRKNYFVLLQDYGKTWSLDKNDLTKS